MKTEYTVITPHGTFTASWDEDPELPPTYAGDEDAIAYFEHYLAVEMVTAGGGRRLTMEAMEPDDLYGFCASEAYGIAIPPLEDDLKEALSDDVEEESGDEPDEAMILDAIDALTRVRLSRELAEQRAVAQGENPVAKIKATKRMGEIIRELGDEHLPPPESDVYAKVSAFSKDGDALRWIEKNVPIYQWRDVDDDAAWKPGVGTLDTGNGKMVTVYRVQHSGALVFVADDKKSIRRVPEADPRLRLRHIPVRGEEGDPVITEGEAAPVPPKKDAWVNEEKAAEVRAIVEHWNKRAAKLGVEPMQVTEDGERFMRWLYGDTGRPVRTVESDRKRIPKGYSLGPIFRQVHILIEGELPQLSGWKFVASIDHEEGGNVLRAIPGGGAVPARYRDAESYCEHCGTKRNRNSTFIVANAEGETKQIGSNCLKDFLGHGNASAIAALADLQSNLYFEIDRIASDDDEESMGGGGGQARYYEDTLDYLTYAAMCVRKWGFTSRGAAQSFGRESTTAQISYQMNPPKTAKPETLFKPEPQDEEMAQKAVEWARNLSDADVAGQDYLNNLRVLARGKAMHIVKHAGLVASMIPAYLKALGVERERKEFIKSEWQGEIGKRQEFKGLFCEKIIPVEGQYGYTFIHKFRDQQGNFFTWFASGNKLDEAKTYDVKATVKAHDDYKGIKQTVLTRAAATEVPEQ